MFGVHSSPTGSGISSMTRGSSRWCRRGLVVCYRSCNQTTAPPEARTRLIRNFQGTRAAPRLQEIPDPVGEEPGRLSKFKETYTIPKSSPHAIAN